MIGGAGPALSIVIVAHNSVADLRRTLPFLIEQLGPGDEIVVVDSGSADDLARELPRLAPAARLLPAGGNVGFAAGANLGARSCTGEVIVLLNPDAQVEPGWAAAMRAAAAGTWAAWMGLVTMDGGALINTSGGVVHFTGLAWSGEAGAPVSGAPAQPADVGFVSGACLAVPRPTWERLGGFSEHFFMYCEDVDLSLRLRLAGGRLAVIPEARVIHDYDFAKGARKWQLLERNRWSTILRCYPGPLLALVAPALLATEAGIWATAVRGRWASMKALATLDLIRLLPRLLAERRQIQATRTIGAAEFAAGLTDELNSAYLGGLAHHPLVRGVVSGYWRLVRGLLGLSGEPARDTARL